MGRIPESVALAATVNWDHCHCGAVLSSLAASKGFASIAEAILELDPETSEDMLRRKFGEEDA